MLRIARILQPARRHQAWLVHCDRCGACSPPISHAAARELDRTDCLHCETDPERLAEAIEDAARLANLN